MSSLEDASLNLVISGDLVNRKVVVLIDYCKILLILLLDRVTLINSI